MDPARYAWLRSTGSARVAVPLLVVLLSVAGFVVTMRAVDSERGNAMHQRAEVRALEVQGQLERARAFTVGLANALEGELVPDGGRFAALAGSATTTVGLTAAMWVERVSQQARRQYEQRIRASITRPPGRQVAGPAPTYLPATFVTGVPVRPGADMALVPVLAATLRDPTSVFAGTATPGATLAGQHGFFLVQGAQFGQGPGSQGFLVVFVPADWLSVSLNLDPDRTAISLDGRPLNGTLATAPAAGQGFVALTRRWRVAVAGEPPTALQATLPWLAVAWPPATALLIYLLGRGMLRRRRAERQVDDIFDLSVDLLCVAGLDGYFKRVNPAFEHTLGYAAADLLSRPFLEFVHPDDRERTATMMDALGQGQHVSDFENRYIRADGAVRWLQWNTRTMPEKRVMYAAARDVTENRMLTHEQAALRRVATLVAERHDPDELFNAVAVEVGQLLSADATRLLRYQQDGTACVVGSYGASDVEIGVGPQLSLDHGRLWGRVARARSPDGADHLRDGSDAVAKRLLAAGLAAAVAVPIVVSGRPWGAIAAAWKRPDMAGGDTELRMAQFTELVATAVANAQSGAELAASRRRIVATADQARQRIERDLHDGAQQRLVSTVLMLRLVRKELGEANDPVAELVEEALVNAQSGFDEVRELARGIHPRILSSGGLGPALATLARRSPIPVTVDVHADGRLPENVEVTAYYVASEALTNAAKHAHASEVDINVQVDDRWLVLTIRDDGVGGADPALGSGLMGLQDRVAALGGDLSVRSAPGGGTVLTAQIPVAAPPAAETGA
ncbi:MAG TPA: PAS domain-containing sensor histidine kinase [Solirubrobacteraceae bacterium]|nr:PAS domain-containing sensor histidine kinase [Solirubrobacteraceae bacterium]